MAYQCEALNQWLRMLRRDILVLIRCLNRLLVLHQSLEFSTQKRVGSLLADVGVQCSTYIPFDSASSSDATCLECINLDTKDHPFCLWMHLWPRNKCQQVFKHSEGGSSNSLNKPSKPTVSRSLSRQRSHTCSSNPARTCGLPSSSSSLNLSILQTHFQAKVQHMAFCSELIEIIVQATVLTVNSKRYASFTSLTHFWLGC